MNVTAQRLSFTLDHSRAFVFISGRAEVWFVAGCSDANDSAAKALLTRVGTNAAPASAPASPTLALGQAGWGRSHKQPTGHD